MSDKDFVVKNGIVVGTTATISGIEIDPSGATSNQVLKFNGTKFVSANQSGSITVSSSAPASPTEGALWFDSDTAQTFIYYDSQWVEVGGAGSGAKMFVSSSAPTSPVEGTLWFNSNTTQTFIHYDSQWVEIGDIINGSQTIEDLNDVTITSAAANQILSYNGSAWVNTSSPTIPGNLTISGNVSISGIQIDTSSSQANDVLKFDGTKYTPGPETIFTTIDAKGDILVGTADNTINRLAVGSNGQLLAANSSTSTGLEWITSPYATAVSPTFTGTVTLPSTTSIGNVSNTEISYLDGVTSAIQTQIDTKASTGKAIAMAIVFGG